jgi:ABC-type phosphate/phosphonate transport system substrate-binding protein|tara:strand:- start:620 stop:1411 length:792 start_codon:yes stop_codon:yes gene_type:complete
MLNSGNTAHQDDVSLKIVSFPWYDLPASRVDLDGFWQLLRADLKAAGIEQLSQSLDRSTAYVDQWCSPELLLSQCCGLDLFTREGANLLPFCRPVFTDVPCTPGNYFSYVISQTTRARPFTKPRIAINSPTSHSGSTVLWEWLQGVMPQQIIVSGSHQASINLVRNDVVDLAAIDAHSWQLLDHTGVNIIGKTSEAPTPPFITVKNHHAHVKDLLTAMHNTIAATGSLLQISTLLPCDVNTYAELNTKAQNFVEIDLALKRYA